MMYVIIFWLVGLVLIGVTIGLGVQVIKEWNESKKWWAEHDRKIKFEQMMKDTDLRA